MTIYDNIITYFTMFSKINSELKYKIFRRARLFTITHYYLQLLYSLRKNQN